MKRLIRLLFLLIMSTVSLGLMGLGLLVWVALQDLPSVDGLKDYQPLQSTIVFDRFGHVIGRFFDERRTVINLNKTKPYVAQAFVAAEDGGFYQHKGIDFMGVARAILLEIKHKTVGGRREGGSTITQQTARTMLLNSRQTYIRKLREMILAKRIEDVLTKDEILHLYLNQIYFGNGAYGIEEGALTYFNKSASALTLSESAALASIPKSPNKINPFGDIRRLQFRQHYVLDQMVKQEFISEKEAETAKSASLFRARSNRKIGQLAPYFLNAVKAELLPTLGEEAISQGGIKVTTTLDLGLQQQAEHALKEGLKSIDKRAGYRGAILRPKGTQDEQLKKLLEEFKSTYLKDDNKTKIWDLSHLAKIDWKKDPKSLINAAKLIPLSNFLVVGARVQSIDEKAQTATIDLGSTSAELAFRDLQWARSYSAEGKKPLPKKISEVLLVGDIILVKLKGSRAKIWASLEQEPIINGGLVALDVKSGGVLAMVGGYDFDLSPYNRITQAKRQVGSGIKPLIYGLAIDKNLANAATIITDIPKAFFDSETKEFWRPRNHTRKYLGDITLRSCLSRSINTCTISLLEKMGIKEFLHFAEILNLNKNSTPYPRNLTIALGSAENYPIEVANAMRIFPNQGRFSNSFMVNTVNFKNGEKFAYGPNAEKQVISEESAFIITNILKDVISPNHWEKYLDKVKCDLSGKTGTTNNSRSVWFFGFSPNILALVYVGYDDNRSVGKNEWGVTTAFPIWANFMNNIPTNSQELSFSVPPNIEWRLVKKDTGKAVLPEQALAGEVINEVFRAGTAPSPSASENNVSNSPLELIENGAFAP